jgi:polysaccharide biosynthesis transport protein
MNLRSYLNPIFKYWWLILIAATISIVSSYLVTRQQPPVYQARTTMVIGRVIYEANPSSTDLYLSQQLAGFYADIGMRSEVQNATMKALGLSWLPEYHIIPLSNSQLIEINVTDTIPERAQAVANELANQLIQISPTSNEQQGKGQQQFIKEQIDYLEGKIKETLEEINQAEKKLSDTKSARQIADTQQEISALQDKLSQLQSNYTALISNTQQGATNTLSVVEPAYLPTVPIGPKKALTIGLSAFLSTLLAVGAAFLLVYLDDTFSSVDEIKQFFTFPSSGDTNLNNNPLKNAPILGYIGKMPHDVHSLRFLCENPQSPIADSFRLLRTNLAFIGIEKKIKVILVSSSNPSDGKSTIAANMAVSLSQVGKKVILVDADLRRPTIHTALDIRNENGLSDLCLGAINVEDALYQWTDWRLNIIRAGSLPPNPVELLESDRMASIFEELKDLADYIIVDAPPLFYANSSVLFAAADCLLFVVCLNNTKKKMITRTFDHIQKNGKIITALVINQVPDKDIPHSGYYYREYHHDPNEKAGGNLHPLGKFFSFFNRFRDNENRNGSSNKIGNEERKNKGKN